MPGQNKQETQHQTPGPNVYKPTAQTDMADPRNAYSKVLTTFGSGREYLLPQSQSTTALVMPGPGEYQIKQTPKNSIG